MNKEKWTLAGSAGLGAGLGAGVMYLLDPQAGGRRRALVRDKAVHVLRKAGEAAGKASCDLGNRARGLLAETSSKLRPENPDDQLLRERLRSKIGHVVSHPSAIDVTVEDGHVILSGPILAAEVDRLLKAVRSVKGVEKVENRLEIHETAEGVPALQGGRTVPRRWRGSKALGAALSAVGLGLLARSLKNRNGRGECFEVSLEQLDQMERELLTSLP
jgi:hypothetical protein